MARVERLRADHADALLAFERENREYFARTVPDRGDGYFADFAARHAALLAEQDAGVCHFHVVVDDDRHPRPTHPPRPHPATCPPRNASSLPLDQ